MNEENITAFQHHIRTWYDTFKRDLPWRGDPDPYHILVSEVMLQQTRERSGSSISMMPAVHISLVRNRWLFRPSGEQQPSTAATSLLASRCETHT